MEKVGLNRSGRVRTVCTICQKGCGVVAYVENGIAHRIEGDPENPLNRGQLCTKGLATLEYVYHPDRVRYPLIRAGNKGEGKWERISWDHALDRIAEEFNRIKNDLGAESVAFIRGASKAYIDVGIGRLANVFGSPNFAAQGQVCHTPRVMATTLTCGYSPMPDIEHPPACLVVWGVNPKETCFCENDAILNARARGTKLIVIDPVKTNLAAVSEHWIRLRPGTDLALALGMIHIMVKENLCDRDFVRNWTVGFEELRTHVEQYTPEKVEEITWIPSEMLIEATLTYAQAKPACIVWGNALDHNMNSFQTGRAITILRVISGNLGVPGGEIRWAPLPLLGRESPPTTDMAQGVSQDDNILPTYKNVIPDRLVRAILNDDPYPVRAAFVQGSNPVLSYNNSRLTRAAFKELDFLVVADMFVTPTAAVADIVLPAATYLEYDCVNVPPQNIPIALAQRKAIQVGECWSDFKIQIELAKRLGVGKEFGWENEQDAFDEILKPSGLTFEKFKEAGQINSKKVFRQYETKGFETPSGKIEIYSKRLEKWGYDSLPTYYEPPETPYSDSALVKKYPFILTCWKPEDYRHSWGHQIPSLRLNHPDPIVVIHPDAAARLSIREGDWVLIETERGTVRQKAKLDADLDERVVVAEFGWWYPERNNLDESGWEESNINVLTDDRTPYNRAMGAANEMGTPTLSGFCCNVHK